MVAWLRTLQTAIFIGASVGTGLMMSYLYDTTNFLNGLVALVIGSGILTLMVVWASKIQTNIENRKRK